MLRETNDPLPSYPVADDRCDPACGCGPGECLADAILGHDDQVLPGYDHASFTRNVEVLNHTLENMSFALGIAARLIEEAFLIRDAA